MIVIDLLKYLGYVTTSKVKIISAVEDNILPDHKTLQRSKDINLKNLFADIHTLYVEYILNPFSSKTGPIVSNRFNNGIQNCVDAFNRRAG